MKLIKLAPPDLMLRRRVAPSRSMEARAMSLAAVLRDACNAVKPAQIAQACLRCTLLRTRILKFIRIKKQGTRRSAMQRKKPPFRADHVGSLLRPAALKAARERRAKGEITAAQLNEIEDREIEAVIKRQENVGLASITDGEFR